MALAATLAADRSQQQIAPSASPVLCCSAHIISTFAPLDQRLNIFWNICFISGLRAILGNKQVRFQDNSCHLWEAQINAVLILLWYVWNRSCAFNNLTFCCFLLRARTSLSSQLILFICLRLEMSKNWESRTKNFLPFLRVRCSDRNITIETVYRWQQDRLVMVEECPGPDIVTIMDIGWCVTVRKVPLCR